MTSENMKLCNMHIGHIKLVRLFKSHLVADITTARPRNFTLAKLLLNEPNRCMKVWKFLQSVKAPKLQTAVAVVKSQDVYLMDFEATISYLHHFISLMHSS